MDWNTDTRNRSSSSTQTTPHNRPTPSDPSLTGLDDSLPTPRQNLNPMPVEVRRTPYLGPTVLASSHTEIINLEQAVYGAQSTLCTVYTYTVVLRTYAAPYPPGPRVPSTPSLTEVLYLGPRHNTHNGERTTTPQRQVGTHYLGP